MEHVAKLLEKHLPSLTCQRDADMGEYTTFKAGGRADYLAEPGSPEQLVALLDLLTKEGIPFMALGAGSNLLVLDGGFRGVMIRMGSGFSGIERDGRQIHAGAGSSLAKVARFAAQEGLCGMEFASGIPGSMGGGAYMNAGAYGGELKDIISSVQVLDKNSLKERTMLPRDLDYGYRSSSLMGKGDFILSVTLTLSPKDPKEILALMKDYTERRNAKQPMEWPSAGSFFKRPQGHFAGKLIEEAGLSGMEIGGAQVSSKHSGFLINRGGAKAADITALMHMVQAAVLEQSGILLEPEIRMVGEEA